jgi:hypothetical protein
MYYPPVSSSPEIPKYSSPASSSSVIPKYITVGGVLQKNPDYGKISEYDLFPDYIPSTNSYYAPMMSRMSRRRRRH